MSAARPASRGVAGCTAPPPALPAAAQRHGRARPHAAPGVTHGAHKSAAGKRVSGSLQRSYAVGLHSACCSEGMTATFSFANCRMHEACYQMVQNPEYVLSRFGIRPVNTTPGAAPTLPKLPSVIRTVEELHIVDMGPGKSCRLAQPSGAGGLAAAADGDDGDDGSSCGRCRTSIALCLRVCATEMAGWCRCHLLAMSSTAGCFSSCSRKHLQPSYAYSCFDSLAFVDVMLLLMAMALLQ